MIAGHPKRPPWVVPALRVAAAALLAVVLLQVVDLDRVLALLARIELPVVIAVLALFGIGQVLSTMRWRLALRQMMAAPPALAGLLRLYLIGMFCNLAMPTMVGGDVVRAELAQASTAGRGNAYASVLADRLIGLIAVVLIAGLALAPAALFLDQLDPRLAAVPPAAALGAFLFLAGIRKYGARAPVPARLTRFVGALRLLARRPRYLGLGLALALAAQAVGVIFPIALLADALAFSVPFGLHLMLVPLATLVPISPNGLGVREGAFVVLYGQVGVTPEAAFALGLAWSLVLTSYGLLGGLCVLGARRPHQNGKSIVLPNNQNVKTTPAEQL